MKNSILFTVIFVLWVAVEANATPVTIQISGTVTSASGTARPGTIYAGVAFTGTYTYDSATPNTSTLSYVGQYVHNSPYGVEISMGGFEFTTVPNHIGQFEIGITNAVVNYDWYDVISSENAFVNGTSIESISWMLGGPPSTISSIALPVTEPVITDWAINVLEISGQNLLIQGTVTQAELVPEPLTGILMAMGAFLIRRRR